MTRGISKHLSAADELAEEEEYFAEVDRHSGISGPGKSGRGSGGGDYPWPRPHTDAGPDAQRITDALHRFRKSPPN